MGTQMVVIGARTTTAVESRPKKCGWPSHHQPLGVRLQLPSPTFFTKHLTTVRAEEVLWVPGLVHCCQYFLEKEDTERNQKAAELLNVTWSLYVIKSYMKLGGEVRYLHPGWEQHSRHSVEKKAGGSPWGSRPSHSAQRRDWNQSLLCSEYRQSALDARIVLKHGSSRDNTESRLHNCRGWSSYCIPCTQQP